MRICDCDLIADFEWLKNKIIVLYGAGYWAKKIYRVLKERDIAISQIVKTTAGQGEMFEDGIPIEQASTVIKSINTPNHLIVITTHVYREEIMTHLEALGVSSPNGAFVCSLRGINASILASETGVSLTPLSGQKVVESGSKISLYQAMHHEYSQYGIGAIHFFPMIKVFTDFLQPKTILDYGCGKGNLVKVLQKTYPQIEVYGFDPAIEGKNHLPSCQIDFLTCTDVLEHIPEEDIPAALNVISKISRYCFFNLHHGYGDILPNGENAHCTIKPITWYYELLRRYFTKLVCLPVDTERSVIITFDAPQDTMDSYMRILGSGLFF